MQLQKDGVIPSWSNLLIKENKKDWIGQGYQWGLRVYTYGKDIGLTFKISLTKNIPNRGSAAIGPNKILHQPAKIAQKVKPTILPTENTFSLIAPFQPIIPDGPPSSADLIISLVNASLEAIHNTSLPEYQECWICFSPTPPFYEGIASFANPIPTNDANSLSWAADTSGGLTLSMVSGLGHCLLGPNMLPPASLLQVCNQTSVVNNSFTYTKAPDNTYLACSLGLTTYIINSVFLTKRDFCLVVFILPQLFIHNSDNFLNFWERKTYSLRTKREPLTAVTLTVILGLSAAGAGTGIASLVTSQQHY